VSAKLGLCDHTLEIRVADTLTRAGLDTDLSRWLSPEVLSRLAVDKKRAGEIIRFVALGGVGLPLLHDIELKELLSLLRD
jgi:3-dehydroquinate synthetase